MEGLSPEKAINKGSYIVYLKSRYIYIYNIYIHVHMYEDGTTCTFYMITRGKIQYATLTFKKFNNEHVE